MGKIIKLQGKSEAPPANLITSKPWEFRRADWESNFFVQTLKSQSAKLENHRKEIHEKGDRGVWHLPPHFVLREGMASTIQGIYRHRENDAKMREVYYLAGLVDCMINQINPVLRTDLIRDLYKRIMALRGSLRVNWYGQMDQVLFPVDEQFFSHLEYKKSLSGAGSLKDLYGIIREGTDEMFDILSLEYVFYAPGRRA